MLQSFFTSAAVAIAMLSSQALADFYVANWYETSCTTVGNGCISYQAYATGLISSSDFSAGGIQGYGPNTMQANPVTENFFVNTNQVCGAGEQLQFSTSDGGATYSISSDGADAGTCHQDTSQSNTGFEGCCPQTQHADSLLYCESSITC